MCVDSGSPKAARKAAERRRKGASAPRPQQLQLNSLHAKLDQLREQYKAAETENKRLKDRLMLMEVVLPTREQQARIAAAGAAGSSGTLSQPQTARPAADADEAANAEPRARSFGPVSGLGQEELGQQPALEFGLGSICSGPGVGRAHRPHSCSYSHTTTSNPDGASSPSACTVSGSGQAANKRAGEEAACAQSRPPHEHQKPPQPWRQPQQPRLQLGPPPPIGTRTEVNRAAPQLQPQQALPGHPAITAAAAAAPAAARPDSVAAATAASGRGPEAAPQGSGELSAAWRALWLSWVRDAALLVVAHDARPRDHWLRQLDVACTQLKTRVVQLGLKHPELIADDMPQLNLDTGRLQEPPEGHWRPVALAMRATPAQVSACRAALALYRERMEVVMAERSRLTERLADSMAGLRLGTEHEGWLQVAASNVEKTSVEAAAAAAGLDENVAAEGRATKIAKDLLSSDMFTPLQCARGSVASYPYFPDALAIITEVARLHEAGQPAAAALQQLPSAWRAQ
ncbi:hypothetical protein CHLRE_03g179250v5 [Chlamydomonas reinhardtii]|uniref:Uncharacterized protein n=1 Tax=Chlamydomonas reinhardtii TaxID=3055 RepID=A0A2K3DXL8_CHLRE|nr:uncharacterized protein CHLRE_03g179250v5 [Chlamydomonas reinhardtii]PNW85279.1 hypothetical protein CHLRE_03g179250v5 [Chlamydomonas reinhardtii]